MVCNWLPIDSRKGPGRQMYHLENYTVEYSGASLSACAKYEPFFPDSLLRLKKLRIVINPWVHQTSIYFATFGPEGPSLGNTVLEHTPVEEATYLANTETRGVALMLCPLLSQQRVLTSQRALCPLGGIICHLCLLQNQQCVLWVHPKLDVTTWTTWT